jgi:hypothetical protein
MASLLVVHPSPLPGKISIDRHHCALDRHGPADLGIADLVVGAMGRLVLFLERRLA